jgi:hypothetical protein
MLPIWFRSIVLGDLLIGSPTESVIHYLKIHSSGVFKNRLLIVSTGPCVDQWEQYPCVGLQRGLVKSDNSPIPHEVH